MTFANLDVDLNTNSPLEFNKGGNLDNFKISNLNFNLNDPESTTIIIGGISNVTVAGLSLNPSAAATARRQRRLKSESYNFKRHLDPTDVTTQEEDPSPILSFTGNGNLSINSLDIDSLSVAENGTLLFFEKNENIQIDTLNLNNVILGNNADLLTIMQAGVCQINNLAITNTIETPQTRRARFLRSRRSLPSSMGQTIF